LLTCKQFLDELSDFLDESVAGELREQLEKHLAECPNCWVVCDTTKKTVEIFKGLDPTPVPENVHDRLISAISNKCCKKEEK
jgi:hypothetical protein